MDNVVNEEINKTVCCSVNYNSECIELQARIEDSERTLEHYTEALLNICSVLK